MKNSLDYIVHKTQVLEKIPGRFKSNDLTEENLQGHRRCQDLAYECALTISKELRPGITEKRVSSLMDTFLKDHGVKSFFHHSFAWFGERTKFKDFNNYRDFLSSKRVLQENEIIILDTAPILGGYVADIGYTVGPTDNQEWKRAEAFLQELRQKIPAMATELPSAQELWKVIDRLIKDEGFTNCHKEYPFGVLGHRVHKVPFPKISGMLRPFGHHAYWAMMSRSLLPELLGPFSKRKLTPGAWAIEPHIGASNFGAKFEEILVVEDNRAYWLSDDVPHVKKKVH